MLNPVKKQKQEFSKRTNLTEKSEKHKKQKSTEPIAKKQASIKSKVAQATKPMESRENSQQKLIASDRIIDNEIAQAHDETTKTTEAKAVTSESEDMEKAFQEKVELLREWATVSCP